MNGYISTTPYTTSGRSGPVQIGLLYRRPVQQPDRDMARLQAALLGIPPSPLDRVAARLVGPLWRWL